jgi:tRNA uridine 5-carboxymethylaminomethyl modification enzyme
MSILLAIDFGVTMTTELGTFDMSVIGAGHAGIEAALAAARLGCTDLCLCTHLDAVGNMPCNPAIGGAAKGQLVREIAALGGEMARAADATCLQFRMLNRGKGPAVHSPRSQNDRTGYRAYARKVLESQAGLFLAEGECIAVVRDADGKIAGVMVDGDGFYAARAVVLATGTFLAAKTFMGAVTRSSGPDGLRPASGGLSDSLRQQGLRLRRFKTGTDRKSVV